MGKKIKKFKSENIGLNVSVARLITPSLLFCLAAMRILSALYNIITDCDETFNYWEPLHYFLFNYGFQTWEYSPLYAIRSYLYILLHGVPLYPLSHFLGKTQLFYLLRLCLATLSIFVEFYFISTVRRKFSVSLSRTLTIVLAGNTGMFISTTAFLPSSFAIYFVTLAYAAWWNTRFKLSIFCIAVSALIGWPFSAALGLPIAIDLVILKRRFSLFLITSLISLLSIGSALIAVDSYFFGRLVFAPANIILYNIFSSSGATLYGTEPVSFYLMNLFLNFNVIFILSSLCVPIFAMNGLLRMNCFLIKNYGLLLLSSVGPCCWLLIFFAQQHKEERFLFPVYPLIALYGSVVAHYLANLCRGVRARQVITILILASYCLLSYSRIIILVLGYRAPINLYSQIYHSIPNSPTASSPSVICVGKEWYRFPSNFFLPTERTRLGFIRSEFRGQLPQYFSQQELGTRVVPRNMNDMNLEEMSSYTPLNSCDYLVDLITGQDSPFEPDYSKHTDSWKIISFYSFLDKFKSHRLFRAFYVPFYSDNNRLVVYNRYAWLVKINSTHIY